MPGSSMEIPLGFPGLSDVFCHSFPDKILKTGSYNGDVCHKSMGVLRQPSIFLFCGLANAVFLWDSGDISGGWCSAQLGRVHLAPPWDGVNDPVRWWSGWQHHQGGWWQTGSVDRGQCPLASIKLLPPCAGASSARPCSASGHSWCWRWFSAWHLTWETPASSPLLSQVWRWSKQFQTSWWGH